jgi:large subunit ribosomal protein L3
MRSQGRVIKGKKLPGHMGCANRVMRQLEVIRIEPETKIALVKGSVPGGSGSLVFIQKA